MEIVLNIIVLIIGAAILIKSADLFVDSAVSISKKLKISPLIIGLTIVAIGTSLPELAVSLTAAYKSTATADLTMSNIVGSNITNITLIIGVSALISPIVIQRGLVRRDGFFLLISAILLLLFGLFFQNDKVIVWYESLILLLVCVLYFVVLIITSKKEVITEEPTVILDGSKPFTKKTIIFFLISIVGIWLGAEMVTNPATYLAIESATYFGLDPSLTTTLVGLTVVAVGTSLPELATAITAAKKGQNEIVLGNAIGSNILNTLFIVGVTGLFAPLGINSAIANDLFILLGITIISVAIMLRKSIHKAEGLLLILIYVGYITFAIIRTLFM